LSVCVIYICGFVWGRPRDLAIIMRISISYIANWPHTGIDKTALKMQVSRHWP